MRLLVSAILTVVFAALPAAAETVYGASFRAISNRVHEVGAADGLAGAALILGTAEAVFYVETTGETALTTPIVLPYEADLMQAALVLALIDSGHVRLGDPRLVDAFRPQAAAYSDGSPRGRQALVRTAESATGRPWAALFQDRVGIPAGLDGTSFPAGGGVPLTRTTTRDYARLISLFAGEGTREGNEIVSRTTLASALRPETAGGRICVEADVAGTCTMIETSGAGLYAFVDRSRGLYGVLTVPGAEHDLSADGRFIQAQATAITDRAPRAPAGLTAATHN